MDHILISKIAKQLEWHKFIHPRQHWFRNARSCEIQLLEFTQELAASMQEGTQTDAIIMDFAQVFDKVLQ